jgi:hypothetical protein
VAGKLSKSDSGEKLEARNKSYEKVLDAQIAWIRAAQSIDVIPVTELTEAQLLGRYRKKSEWHEKEFGW